MGRPAGWRKCSHCLQFFDSPRLREKGKWGGYHLKKACSRECAQGLHGRHLRRLRSRARRSTKPERQLRRLLVTAYGCGAVRREERFGPYVVDFYIPALHVAFEADGDYWYGRPGVAAKDARRDAWLMEHHSLPVARLTETELRKIDRGQR